MVKNIKSFFFSFLFLICIACNPNHSENKEKRETGIRIVSLAQSISKELTDLGLEKSIVGATNYCDITKTNKDLIIGTSTEVNIEKIMLLKPDIVFASGLTSQNTITLLTNNGIKVHQYPKMRSFSTICKHFREIGKMTGKEEVADSIVNGALHKIDILKNSIPKQSKKAKMFFQIGANPLFSVIPDSYMDDLISFAGCQNIASDLKSGTITRESVLKRNPDIIFIASMGVAGDQEKQTWESYLELSASKTKKIFIIDSNMACNPTVLSFTKTLEQMINRIYF